MIEEKDKIIAVKGKAKDVNIMIDYLKNLYALAIREIKESKIKK